MSVGELVRRLQACDQTAEVIIDDEPLGDIEPIETDNGPAVLIWSKSKCD